MTKYLTVRCKAFATEGVRTNKIEIDGTTIRVWDSVAQHYTTCHSLSAATQRKLIAKARGTSC